MDIEIETNYVLIDNSDYYEHPDDCLEYILENILQEKPNDNEADDEYRFLCDQYNSILINKCQCASVDDCIFNCGHGANYKQAHGSTELVLNKDRKNGDIIYECSSLCNCDLKKCMNRLVQYGPRKNLKIIDSLLYNSKGLKTIADIPLGAFICEYAGELLTTHEALKRFADNKINNKNNYILCLNEHIQDSKIVNGEINKVTTIVDPSSKGNIGRYLNHNCEPNCEIFSVRIDCPIPKLAIFAKRDIAAGEELCFHYGGEQIQKNNVKLDLTPCLCDSKKCSKFMPFMEFMSD